MATSEKMHYESERKDQAIQKRLTSTHFLYKTRTNLKGRVVYQYKPQDKKEINTAIRGCAITNEMFDMEQILPNLNFF